MSDNNGQHEEHEHHLSPLSLYIKVFAGLIILTILTVATSYFDFGIMNIVVAMVIAVIKASLVIFFFMQLKYDNIGDKVAFAAAFVFLAIFSQAAAADTNVDQNKLRIATPEMVAKGKDLFHTNGCYTCHGETGHGDGMAAAALNPKPRDFTSGYWKFGGAPTQVFHTITIGSPGTGMAPYGHLSVADRYALAAYVRSFHSPQPDDTDATLKAAGLLNGGKGAVAAEAPSIPIDMAMADMEVPDQVILPSGPEMDPQSPGAKIYKTACLSCHGVNGMGAKTMALGVNPSTALMTASFAGSQSPWVGNSNEFENIVVHGFPGRGMPGIGNLSKSEMTALYGYVRELARK